MKNLNCQFSGRLYAVKRQYPVIVQFEKRMNTVKRELNRDFAKKVERNSPIRGAVGNRWIK